MAIPFDTLKFVERLEAGGFTHSQAKAAAEAFAEATSQELATKADIAALKGDIARLEATMKADMREQELRMTIKLGTLQAVLVAMVAALVKLL
ncbi:MAG: CCDC90 family protein [Alphaproteobacteria bacterium]